jgi:hypothetical protein
MQTPAAPGRLLKNSFLIFVLKGRRFKCVREISLWRFRVEQGQQFLAAK